jgi:5-methyltetrahydropteroyltriglutamate--homocysteine methyltransferase
MQRGMAGPIAHQVESDIVSDGEMSKISYATYIRHRFDRVRGRFFAAFSIGNRRDSGLPRQVRFARARLRQRISPRCAPTSRGGRMRSRTPRSRKAYMNAVSPGTIAVFQPNEYYPSHEAYMEALAGAMHEGYENPRHRRIFAVS